MRRSSTREVCAGDAYWPITRHLLRLMPSYDRRMLPTIVVALLRQDGRLLLVGGQESDDRSGWMLPGGQVEATEALLDALARELAEETGFVMRGCRCPQAPGRARVV